MDIYLLCVIAVLLTGIVFQLRVLIQNSDKNVISQNILKRIDELQATITDAKKGKVTDPFEVANKFNTPGASSSHIVIRKTPDQIRNENFMKIKEGGAKYGDY